jgi:hypothetical protein
MAVSKSPFSKKNNTDTTTSTTIGPAGINPFEESNTPSLLDEINNITLAGYVNAGGGSDKLKTTVRQEKQALDKSYRSALARISRSTTMSEKEKNRYRKRLEDIYTKGMTQSPKPGILSQIGSEIKDFVSNPIAYVGGDILSTSATIGRGVQSGAKEIADLTLILGDKAGVLNERARNYVRGGYEPGDYLTKEQQRKLDNPNNPNEEIGGLDFSFGDFKRQTFNKDFRMMPQTGNGFIDWTVDFGADLVTDPINRIGVGNVRYFGFSGRTELAVKFGTEEMLSKYPQLVGKIDDIGTYGAAAIPKDVRVAEGIEYGLRFRKGLNPFSEKAENIVMIPKTDIFHTALSGKSGVLTQTRLLAGEAARKIGTKTGKTGTYTAASRLGLKTLGYGTGQGLADQPVIEEIAKYTSAKWAKGFKAEAYRKNVAGIKDLLKEIRDAGVAEDVYKLVESPEAFARSTNTQLKEFATRYKVWQDEVRQGVNNIRIKFNDEFGANMKEIGFVDDYLHHKMTDKAFRFAYGPKGQSAKYAGYFKDADLSSVELGQNTGAAMHRTIGAPAVMPDGSISYSKFMGEDVVLDDNFPTVIDKVNEIFRRKTGESFNFFETDIFAIADSYAYSMAAARGREAYVRRLLDYGGDVAQIINKKAVPDDALLATLTTAHTGLTAVRQRLLTKVMKTRNLANEKAEAVLKTARKVLDEKDSKAFLLDTDIAATTKKLNELEVKLNNALINASVKGQAERGAFVEIHSALIEQVQVMRAAIEAGRLDELVAHNMLKDIFLKMRPDAKRIPNTASKLYDAITRQMGINDPTDLREATKRLKALQAQLKDNPPVDADEMNELLEIEEILSDQINGFQVLSDVKMTADYAEDGLLYTSFDNLTPREFDPSAEMPLRVADTQPVTGGYGPDMTVDEIATLRQAQLSDPNSVAVHAIPTEQMADLRDPEWWTSFWHPEDGSVDAVMYAVSRAGADFEDGIRMALDDLMNHGFIESEFRQAFPEGADLVEYIVQLGNMTFPEGVVPEDVLVDVFRALNEKFYALSFSLDPFNAEIAAKQMYDDFLAASVNEVLNRGYNGDFVNLLLPSQVVHGFDNPMAEGVYSVIMPEGYNYADEWGLPALTDDLIDGQGSAVMFTANQENELMQAIINSDYHTAAFEAAGRQSQAEAAVQDLISRQAANEGLQSEVKSVAGKIGGMKSAGSRRVKAAEKAWKQYEESGLIDIVDGSGKKVKVTVDEAQRILNKSEVKLHNKLMAMEDKLLRSTDRTLAPIQRDIAYHEQRLQTLVDQKRVIERWNASTGDALRSEVEALTIAIQTNPPAGDAGTYSRIWTNRVTDRINNIARLEGTGVKDAWERVAVQLSADEAKLALYDGVLIPNSLRDIDASKFAGLADDILDGWTAIESLGIQVPKEMSDILKPNIEQLRKAATSNTWFQAYKRYNQIFKIYATMTPGFVVRNAYSAAFMNKIAGVDNKAIMDGTKAMIAYHKHGPSKWLDVLGVTDAADREVYETAMRSVMATGRGIQSDFISPALAGTWGERVVNNKATQLLGRANEFVENSVRFPMALDSMRKGYGYDEAVYRISRYHFDYTDLSKTDEMMKNFIPFWVWTTKNLPLQLVEQMIHPQYYQAYNRIQESNPVSSEILLPAWLSESRPMGFLGGNNIFSPDLPQLRLRSTAEGLVDPMRLLGQANPLVKLPIELSFDKQSATGQPFTGKYDKAKGLDKAVAWLADNLGIDAVGRTGAEGELEINPKFNYALGNLLPTIGTAQRISGGAIGGKPTYEERQLSSLATFFGLPMRSIGEGQQRGEAISRQFRFAEELKGLAQKGKIEKNK